MAEAKKKSFPMLPIAHWWALRKKFKQSIPGVVTDNYLATVLDMGVNSARANVLPFLKTLGIINEDGKTGERAKLWRDDQHYAQVCKAIVKEVYPNDLIEAAPSPSTDKATAERWFANRTGSGEAAVKRMASLYTVLAEADLTKQVDQQKKNSATQTATEGQRKTTSGKSGKEAQKLTNKKDVETIREKNDKLEGPDININLQIHISADATGDQIDQIFLSMAKHIYHRS